MDQTARLDICELFFKMEEEKSLFDLRTKKGHPLWDIVRNQVSYKLLYTDNFVVKRSAYKVRIVKQLKTFTLFLKIFLIRRKIFFFGASRFPNLQGEYYDPYFEQTKNILKENFIFFETVIGKDVYAQKNHIYPVLPVIKQIFNPILQRLKLNQKDINTFNKIVDACNFTFGAEIISVEEIEKLYLDFLTDYYFYKSLFFLKPSIKCLLLHQNGFQKGLISAAQANNIKVAEFQHADIVEANIVWHYGFNKFISNKDFIFPDIFMTFSDVWSKNNNIPCKCIEIGSNHYNIERIWVPNSTTIGVISTKEHEEILNMLVKEISKTRPDLQFLYKLHPAQFSRYDDFALAFKDCPNVKIFPVNLNMSDLMNHANKFIVIYSSVIFELLQSGKIVFIYKKMNYWFFKRYMDLPNVFSFNDAADFVQLETNASDSYNTDLPIKFFKPFNASAFKTVVEEYV